MAFDLNLLLREWFERVWNGKDASAIEQLTVPGAIVHGLSTDPQPGGVEHFRVFRANFINAFPDLKIVIHDVVVAGNRAAARFSFTGTHQGDGLAFPATGKKISVTGMTFTHWKEGKMTEGWNEFDQASMMRQLTT